MANCTHKKEAQTEQQSKENKLNQDTIGQTGENQMDSSLSSIVLQLCKMLPPEETR